MDVIHVYAGNVCYFMCEKIQNIEVKYRKQSINSMNFTHLMYQCAFYNFEQYKVRR